MAVSGASSVTLLFLALSPEPAGVALLLLRSEMFLLTVSSSGCHLAALQDLNVVTGGLAVSLSSLAPEGETLQTGSASYPSRKPAVQPS